MRVSKEKAAENRRKILDAAARLFRERGIDGCGVDAVTAAADLTHGAFYSQFASKEAVAAEALRQTLRTSRRRWQSIIDEHDGGLPALLGIVSAYLADAHCHTRGKGCAIAALGSDLARQPAAVRDVFTEELAEALGDLAALVPAETSDRRRDEAITALSSMVGGVILARAVSDEKLSKRIRRSVERATTERLSSASAPRAGRARPRQARAARS